MAAALGRSLLLAELDKEEKEKDWYYAQLQDLTKRIDSLPLTGNVRTPATVWEWARVKLVNVNVLMRASVSVLSTDRLKSPSA